MDFPRRTLGHPLRRSADDGDVAIDGRCSPVRNRADGNRSVFAEAGRRLPVAASIGIAGFRPEKNARSIRAIARLVAHTALRCGGPSSPPRPPPLTTGPPPAHLLRHRDLLHVAHRLAGRRSGDRRSGWRRSGGAGAGACCAAAALRQLPGAGSVNSHTSLPVSPSIATTRRPLDTT